MNYIPTSWNPWLCVRLAIILYLSTQVWVQYTCTQTLSALRTGYRQLRGLSPPADTFLSLERNLDPSQASWPVHSNCVVLHALPCLTCKQDCMPTNSKHWAKSHSRSIHANFHSSTWSICCCLGNQYYCAFPLPRPQVIISRQDKQLEQVGASVHTLKKIGETIGDELDDQQMLVQNTPCTCCNNQMPCTMHGVWY